MMICCYRNLKTLEGDNVGMGLFEKFKKKNETHKESYSKEQKELKIYNPTKSGYIWKCFFRKKSNRCRNNTGRTEVSFKNSRSFYMVFKRIWLWWILVRHNGVL